MKLHIQLLLALLAIGYSYSQLLHAPIMHYPADESRMDNLVNLRGSALPNGPLTYGPSAYYCAQFQIGAQKTPVNMLIDSGSTTIWTPAPGANYATNTFNCSASSTCNLTSTPISKTYGTSSASTQGYMFYDDITFAGATLKNFSMGLMNTVASSNGCDGIAGQCGLDTTGAGTLAVEFHKAGFTSSSTFSVYIGKNPTNQSLAAGQLTYGGYNPALLDGNFTFLPKYDRKWTTLFNGMSLGNNSIYYSQANTPYVTFDTGDPVMLVPVDWANAIANAINNLNHSTSNCTYNTQTLKYTCDCSVQNSLPSLFLSLGGNPKPFELRAVDYFVKSNGKCSLNFQINSSTNNINLGTPFLKYFYLMFSWENNTIGLGNIPQNVPTTFSL